MAVQDERAGRLTTNNQVLSARAIVESLNRFSKAVVNAKESATKRISREEQALAVCSGERGADVAAMQRQTANNIASIREKRARKLEYFGREIADLQTMVKRALASPEQYPDFEDELFAAGFSDEMLGQPPW